MITNRNHRQSSKWIVVLMLGGGMLWSVGFSAYAEPPINRPVNQSAEQAAEQQEESLDVRYARAHLELAKLDLQRAEYWNKVIPGLISTRTIDYLRKHVQVDEEQLRQSSQPEFADVHQIYIRGAQAALELAEADVARRQASYESVGGTYAAMELDRAIAVLDVARLDLERTVSQPDSMQSISYLQWQLEELRNQVLELQIKAESLPHKVTD